jgi:hypothetical protein
MQEEAADPLEDPGAERKMILKWIIKKLFGRELTRLI